MAIGSALSVGLIGLKAFIIQIQAFISPGLPYFSIIGLPDTSLSEARERVKSACQASGFKWPETRVTVNLSPASMPKKGSSHDLAIAASVLSASGTIWLTPSYWAKSISTAPYFPSTACYRSCCMRGNRAYGRSSYPTPTSTRPGSSTTST